MRLTGRAKSGPVAAPRNRLSTDEREAGRQAGFKRQRERESNESQAPFEQRKRPKLLTAASAPMASAAAQRDAPASAPWPEPARSLAVAGRVRQSDLFSVEQRASARHLLSARGEAAVSGVNEQAGVDEEDEGGNDLAPAVSAAAQEQLFGQAAAASLGPFGELGLHAGLANHVHTKFGFERPTRIQAQAIPWLQRGRDVLIQAQTGSGKTLAFILPLLTDLLNQSPRITRADGTFAIVLAPTRELAGQSHEVLRRAASPFPNLVCALITGGQKRKAEKASLRKGVTIIVGTPGRLYDHMRTTQSLVLSRVRWLVLDEADRLLDQGFEHDLRAIIAALDKAREQTGRERRSVLVSATLSAAVTRLATISLHNPVRVALDKTSDSSGTAQADDAHHPASDMNQASNMMLQVQTEAAQGSVEMPTQLRQFFTVVPAKQRLVTLLALLRWKAKPGVKIVVFFSSCDEVDYHYALCAAMLKAGRFAGANADATKARGDSGDAEGNGDGGENSSSSNVIKGSSCCSDDGGDGGDSDDDDDDGSGSDDGGSSDAGAHNARQRRQRQKRQQRLQQQQARVWPGAPVLESLDLMHLHGQMEPAQRAASLSAFARSKRGAVLFCTDVAARGLDLPLVKWIVQYDPPSETGEYVHRVGRTARMGHEGSAMLFLLPSETGYVSVLREQGLNLDEVDHLKVLHKLTRADAAGRTLEEACSELQSRLEAFVDSSTDLRTLAAVAFQSFVRAYSTHARDVKTIFHVRSLHLGHLAKAFGLRLVPTALASETAHSNHSAKQQLAAKHGNKRLAFETGQEQQRATARTTAEGVLKKRARVIAQLHATGNSASVARYQRLAGPAHLPATAFVGDDDEDEEDDKGAGAGGGGGGGSAKRGGGKRGGGSSTKAKKVK